MRSSGVLATVLMIVAVGCSESGAGTTRINAAGSTFAYPLYAKWADAFAKTHPGVQIDYQPLGSGAGINLISDGRIDFGGTDGPMTEKQLQNFVAERGGAVLHVPVALGADVPSYNVPGVTQTLRFTPKALSGIFLGSITKWNDPELASANPGVVLPKTPIVVVHRSDGSGTTYIWADYLSKVSEEWRNRVGRGTSVNWPVGTGVSGNQGVADMIKVTPDAIGYVELTYAIREKLLYGDVENRAGQYVRANFGSVTAAADASVESMPADFRVSITDPPGEHAYPISSFTWALVPARIPDRAKKETIAAFLNWGLTEGQTYAEQLSYARLPPSVVEKAKTLVATIQ